MRTGDIIKFDIPDPGEMGFKRIRGVGLVVELEDMGPRLPSVWKAAVLCKGKIRLCAVPKYSPSGFEVLNETR
tara:strand:+ start:84 stop:302 length:219 start_codon:yes stop_codon:yes gene_type:complete